MILLLFKIYKISQGLTVENDKQTENYYLLEQNNRSQLRIITSDLIVPL